MWNSFGRRVNRGEHGIRILAPIVRRLGDKEEFGEGEHRIVGFSVVSVFDVSQTSGDPIDEIAPELLWPLPLTLFGFTLLFVGIVLMRMRGELARNRGEARLRRTASQ